MKLPALLLFLTLGARADLTDNALRDIQFDQKVGSQVSMSLSFTNESGKSVTLAGCAEGKPVVLALGYYHCPMLCTLELNELVASLQDLKPAAANLASIIFVSIDPTETPSLAAAKKAAYMKLYARKEAAANWHFLTGSESAIKTLAGHAGFRFAYDPASRQYAHPSGLVILTPEGKISRYFFGISYAAKDLGAALREASAHRTGDVVRQFVYLCFHYDPIRGKYGATIMAVVRLGGVATLAGLAGLIWMAGRPRGGKEAVCRTE
jgi:protein SCO1/2